MQILQIINFCEVQQLHASGRLLKMEVTLSVNDVGILAIVPESACHQTTDLYRLESAEIYVTLQVSIVFVGLVSALVICVRVI